MANGLLNTLPQNFGSLSWLWRCKEHPCPSIPNLGLWRMLEVPDWSLASCYSLGYGHWFFILPWSEFWLWILIMKMQRTSMFLMSWFGALEDAEGSSVGFCILFEILIWSLVVYIHDLYFCPLSWFWRCKDHYVLLRPDLGLWRMLQVPDWSFASWYWFGYADWPLVHPYSKFWLSILILKVQRTSMSFKSWFGSLEDAGGSWPGFCILILILIWSLDFCSPIFWILALYLDFEGTKNFHVL